MLEGQKKVFIIAEVSANHRGDIEKAKQIIRAAAESGADAIKLQTYTADCLTLNSNLPDFKLPNGSPWIKYKNYYGLYSQSFTPWDWHTELFNEAKNYGLVPFSSPFSESAVDFLESIECEIYKLASPEINFISLIRKIARTGKPIIISLGTASREDLEMAIKEFRAISKSKISILQCDSSYPAKPEESNIRLINYLATEYGLEVGYSDHTTSSLSAVIAVANGATIVEKHLTLGESEDEIDGFFSANPGQFKKFCSDIRECESILGLPNFRRLDSNEISEKQRSIYLRSNLAKGDEVKSEDLAVVRPGLSIHPRELDKLVGKIAVRDLQRGERLSLKDFSNK
jgi:pseudaminic acid synthase